MWCANFAALQRINASLLRISRKATNSAGHVQIFRQAPVSVLRIDQQQTMNYADLKRARVVTY